ncbi:hypothetical protein OAK87_01465 [bacterium]|nr:hypothetical protein [bacterium]
MAVTTKQQRQQRRSEALKLISDGVPPTDAATQLSHTWGCSRRTSLRDVALAQGELATALDSVELQHMVGWLATQYQRLAARAEADKQFSAAVGALNALRSMLIQPQLDAQFAAHHRGRHTHQVHRR